MRDAGPVGLFAVAPVYTRCLRQQSDCLAAGVAAAGGVPRYLPLPSPAPAPVPVVIRRRAVKQQTPQTASGEAVPVPPPSLPR